MRGRAGARLSWVRLYSQGGLWLFDVGVTSLALWFPSVEVSTVKPSGCRGAGTGTTVFTLQDAASVHGLLITSTFRQGRGVSVSVRPRSFVGQRSPGVGRGLGICCVNVCVVILVFQPGSPSKRTDKNGYPTSCQDGIKHKDFGIKTIAPQRGKDAGTRLSDFLAFAYGHHENHLSCLVHALCFLSLNVTC